MGKYIVFQKILYQNNVNISPVRHPPIVHEWNENTKIMHVSPGQGVPISEANLIYKLHSILGNVFIFPQ